MNLLSVKEAYQRIVDSIGSCSLKTVYCWIYKGKLPSMKVGSAVMVPESQLNIFLSKIKNQTHLGLRIGKKAAA